MLSIRTMTSFLTRAGHRLGYVLALLVLAAPSRSQELVLAVSQGAVSLPILVADDQGYFASEGVAVRTQECIDGRRCMKLLLDGKAQLATAGDLPIVFGSFEQTDFAIIATIVSSNRDLKLVTRKSASITTPKQLEGKRVATVKGATAQYFLDSYLSFNDVDVTRVTVVPLSPEQMASALERREVDVVAIWEPFAYLTMKAVGPDGAILASPRIYTQTFNLVTDRRTIATREGDLVKVLRALARGEQFIREQPKRAQSIMLQRLKVDQAFVDWAWNDLAYRISLDQSLVITLEGEARWAVREGHVVTGRRVPNYLDFVYQEPLRKAVPGAVTLPR
ncbi:MAG: ABC transporter substrate-binding protein [Betaproteobacteria bacterium]